YLLFMLLAIATFLMAFSQLFPVIAQNSAEAQLPTAKVHVLPPTLASWQDPNHQGDYFDRVESTPLGYLIWSEFPVKVYIDKPNLADDASASKIRSEQWLSAVVAAVVEWNDYLPLSLIEKSELADIVIKRSPPPVNAKVNSETGLFDIPRARTAQTRYEFYLDRDKKIVSARTIVEISPDRGDRVIKAAARHEIGHALGIWGHSPDSGDALYFSATSDPPSISVRDINTLKKIYQQPTKLGWAID
ncbi:MAG: peptidase, partial [Xenococcaceae cyanobacterium]